MKIVEYEVRDYGYDHAQYFPGAGTAFTRWTDVYLGAGDSPAEALEDALTQAASIGWNVEEINDTLSDESKIPACEECEEGDEYCDHDNELYHYVAVFIR